MACLPCSKSPPSGYQKTKGKWILKSWAAREALKNSKHSIFKMFVARKRCGGRPSRPTEPQSLAPHLCRRCTNPQLRGPPSRRRPPQAPSPLPPSHAPRRPSLENLKTSLGPNVFYESQLLQGARKSFVVYFTNHKLWNDKFASRRIEDSLRLCPREKRIRLISTTSSPPASVKGVDKACDFPHPLPLAWASRNSRHKNVDLKRTAQHLFGKVIRKGHISFPLTTGPRIYSLDIDLKLASPQTSQAEIAGIRYSMQVVNRMKIAGPAKQSESACAKSECARINKCSLFTLSRLNSEERLRSCTS